MGITEGCSRVKGKYIDDQIKVDEAAQILLKKIFREKKATKMDNRKGRGNRTNNHVKIKSSTKKEGHNSGTEHPCGVSVHSQSKMNEDHCSKS